MHINTYKCLSLIIPFTPSNSASSCAFGASYGMTATSSPADSERGYQSIFTIYPRLRTRQYRATAHRRPRSMTWHSVVVLSKCHMRPAVCAIVDTIQTSLLTKYLGWSSDDTNDGVVRESRHRVRAQRKEHHKRTHLTRDKTNTHDKPQHRCYSLRAAARD